MAKSQYRSIRKVSGRKYVNLRKKRLCDLRRNAALTLVDDKPRIKLKRVKGGNSKKQLLTTKHVMVNNKGKTVKLEIKNVENNPANVNYTRRSIITKGTIVKTDKGNVKITSRPGQTGTLFGVFV